jgi:hypothetical protein
LGASSGLVRGGGSWRGVVSRKEPVIFTLSPTLRLMWLVGETPKKPAQPPSGTVRP